MKTKITTMAIIVTVLAFAGCERNSKENTPTPVNSPGDQPISSGEASNDAAVPPALTNWVNTNSPANTNAIDINAPSDTHAPTGTNQ